MLCGDIINRDVKTCDPTDTAIHCARIMREHDVGIVPVVDSQARPLGVVTDRDLALRVLADRREPTITVSHIMSTAVVTCRTDDSLRTAEQKLARSQKSRIVVVYETGKIAGVLSLSDIAQHETPESAGDLLRRITRREAPDPRISAR